MLLTHLHSSRRYIVLPFYPLTLKSHFQSYIDAIVAAPSDEAAAALLPDEREVLLLLVQLCAALVHLQQHHVVHRDFKVGILGCCGRASSLLTHTLTRHPALPAIARRTTFSLTVMAASKLATLARWDSHRTCTSHQVS